MSTRKHYRMRYPDRVNKMANNLFALVHSDIWGPCTITSNFDFKYFMIFVNDFS